ncbi:14220_t:CDS:2, partial [Funneliformis geosporum]
LELWLLDEFELDEKYRPKDYKNCAENIDIIRDGEWLGSIAECRRKYIKNQLAPKVDKSKVSSVDDELFKKLIDVSNNFWEEFEKNSLSCVCPVMVDKEPVIVASVYLPEDSIVPVGQPDAYTGSSQAALIMYVFNSVPQKIWFVRIQPARRGWNDHHSITLESDVRVLRDISTQQIQTLITPDGTRTEFNEDQALLPKINYEPPSRKLLRICFIIFSSFIVPIFFRFVGNTYVDIATIFVVTCMAVYLHEREYSERNRNIV